MTITLNPTANGRSQRKNLSSQLDRLDTMLDGLDKGLQGAITDAVREAVSAATSEAVQATLIQIVTNPDIHALIRTSLASLIQQAMPQQPVPATAVEQAEPLRNALSRALNRSVAKLKAIGLGIRNRIRRVRDGIVGTYRQATSVWRLRRPVLIALVVGGVAGAVGYAAAPWVAGVVSGVAATVAALGTQLAVWARRVFSRFPIT